MKNGGRPAAEVVHPIECLSPRPSVSVPTPSGETPARALNEVVQAVCWELSISPEVLARRSSRHPARSILAAVAHQHSAATLEEIAQQLGLAGRDSVHKKIQRVRESSDADVQECIRRIEQHLRF